MVQIGGWILIVSAVSPLAAAWIEWDSPGRNAATGYTGESDWRATGEQYTLRLHIATWSTDNQVDLLIFEHVCAMIAVWSSDRWLRSESVVS